MGIFSLLEADQMIAEAAAHGLADLAGLLEREGGCLERRIHLALAEKPERALVVLHGRILGIFRCQRFERFPGDGALAKRLDFGERFVRSMVADANQNVRCLDLLWRLELRL